MLSFLLRATVTLLVLKVTAAIVAGYVDYFPPNFRSDFLHGRQGYFFGGYHWAFYGHILTGPVALLLGTLLSSTAFLKRFPTWHRRLGKLHCCCVLLGVAPTGLWIAWFARSGIGASIGFSLLAGLTAFCTTMGWRRAVQRRFVDHRAWMTRSTLLLYSAVVLRLLGGLGTILDVQFAAYDLIAGWVSWIGPLLIFEIRRSCLRHSQQRRARPYWRPAGTARASF
jgi:hypothetical protein